MKLRISTSALAACLVSTTLVRAADDVPPYESETPVVAPVRAWEFTFGQGYYQGFGQADDGADLKLQDLGRGGPSLQLGFGYRINPRLFLGVYAEGARHFAASGVAEHTEVYSAATGIQAQWHFLPFSPIDPWVSLGSGVRAYWVDREATQTESLYGVDIARLRLGADYQLGPSTRIGPMIGATLSVFGGHRSPTDEDIETIDDPGLTTFVFAGMQGRFEIGGKRITKKQAALARR